MSAIQNQMPGPKAVTISVTPTISTSAYTTGRVVGGVMSFASALGNYSLSGKIQNATINCKTVQTCTFSLFLFNANPTASTFTDTNAAAINAADINKVCGVIASGTASSALGTHTTWNIANITQEVVSATASLQTIYGVLIVAGTPTFTSTSDLTINLTVLQD